MSIQQKALAPRAARSSIWLAVLLDARDGDRTVLNEVFTDVEEAATCAFEEIWLLPVEDQQHFSMHLVQVVLDRDTPARWADDVMQRFEALDDGRLNAGQRKVLDTCTDIVKDYTPAEVGELGTAEGLAIVDDEGERETQSTR